MQTSEISPEVLSDLAPSGRLRVGINFGNALLTRRDPATGAPGGIAVDLAWELGRRLGAPVDIVSYESAGDLAAAADKAEWEVGFLAVEAKRADKILFTAPYVEIESGYMVPPGSPLKMIEDVDRENVRIAVSDKSAYDLFLSRTLKHATLVRVRGGTGAFEVFVSDKLEALAGLKPMLLERHKDYPEARVLDGRFTAVLQGAGVPKGRDAGAAYLSRYIEDAKASGLVDRVIKSNRIEGVTVAPKI